MAVAGKLASGMQAGIPMPRLWLQPPGTAGAWLPAQYPYIPGMTAMTMTRQTHQWGRIITVASTFEKIITRRDEEDQGEGFEAIRSDLKGLAWVVKMTMKVVVGDNQGSLEDCAGHCPYEVRHQQEDDERYHRLLLIMFDVER